MAQNRVGITIETKESGSKSASETVSKNLGQVEKQTRAATQAADDFKSHFSFVGTAAKAATATVVASATAFVGFGLASATSLQTTAASFRALTGDATTAKNLFTDLYNFARGTPFAFPDVTDAARTLLGYGRSAQDVTSDIKTLGGLVATTGADWSRLAVVYGQVNAAGKLYAQDALQLIENGVPITTALAKQLGVSITDVRDKMANGEISAQMFNDAMRNMVPADAIEKLSNTMTGRLSGLTGSVRALAFSLIGIDYSKFDDGSPVLVQQGGLFDRLTKAVQRFSDVMSTPELKGAAKQIGAGIADFVDGAGQKLVEWIKWGATHLPEIKFALIGVASAIVAFKIGNVVTDLVAFARAAKSIGMAFAAMSLSPIVLAVAAAAALAAGVVYLQTKFNIFGKAADGIKTAWGYVQDAWEKSTEYVKGAFSDALKAGGDAVDWMRDRVKDGIDFYKSYEGWIKGIAITLGVIFGPALVRAGLLAVAQGAKIAASGIAAGAGWVAGSVVAAAKWAFNLAKTVALSVVQSAKMVAHAVAVGVAHSAAAVKSAAIWVVKLALMVLRSAGAAVVMAAHAADVGWAWVFNATRASFTWVVLELPKIVAAMAVTSAKAGVQAAVASAAWVAHAAQASFAWVTTELPKIVAGFVATAASATAQAAITSAKWVASATASAVAWVITELPRIIAGFVAAAVSAGVQAAIASGAWIAAAVASLSAWVAASAVIATPVAVVISVAAALAAIAAVVTAYNNMQSAISQSKDMKTANDQAGVDLRKLADKKLSAGAISQKEHDRLYQVSYLALGTNYAKGGNTVVGEHGPEIVNMPAGARVTPAYRTRTEQKSSNNSGGGVNIEQLIVNNNMDEQRVIAKIGRKLALR